MSLEFPKIPQMVQPPLKFSILMHRFFNEKERKVKRAFDFTCEGNKYSIIRLSEGRCTDVQYEFIRNGKKIEDLGFERLCMRLRSFTDVKELISKYNIED